VADGMRSCINAGVDLCMHVTELLQRWRAGGSRTL